MNHGRRCTDPWYMKLTIKIEDAISDVEDWLQEKYGRQVDIATGCGFIVALVMAWVFWGGTK